MNKGILIKRIDKTNDFLNDLIELEILLWPDNIFLELKRETELLMENNNTYLGAFINDSLIGFIQASIRNEYVNGSTVSPVGFIEGIYVKEENRYMGIGRMLIDEAIERFRLLGIEEVASDADIDNLSSHKFHRKCGFSESERVVCFIRKI